MTTTTTTSGDKPKLSLKAKPAVGGKVKLSLKKKSSAAGQKPALGLKKTDEVKVKQAPTTQSGGVQVTHVGSQPQAPSAIYAKQSPSVPVQPLEPQAPAVEKPAAVEAPARAAPPAERFTPPPQVPDPAAAATPRRARAGQQQRSDSASPSSSADQRRGRGTRARPGGDRAKRPQEQQYRTGRNRMRRRDPNQQPIIRKAVGRVEIGSTVGIAQLAKSLAYRSEVLVKICRELGEQVHATDVIDWDLASLVVEHLGGVPVLKVEQTVTAKIESELVYRDLDSPPSRPPIVTVMGHVDHGKTSLLDYIRSSRVASGESGGITQHIGASLVRKGDRDVCFIDTPGHAAFSQMRRRGAQVTDIVILVVAANDGVMPQTEEALSQALAADVGIVVAINKCDLRDANPARVRGQLIEKNVIPDDSGGDVQFVEVSAETGDGVDDLLQAVLDEADVRELTAPVSGPGQGIVLESHVAHGIGPVATVLVNRGVLKVGDKVVASGEFGRVRALTDDIGTKVKSASPAVPVLLQGLGGVVEPGTAVFAVASDKKARRFAEDYRDEADTASVETHSQLNVDEMLQELLREQKHGKRISFPLIVRTDVAGTCEAIREALTSMTTDEIEIQVIRSSTGEISEMDIEHAAVSGALVIGFNVRATPAAIKKAEAESVDVRYFSIIYELLDDVRALASGQLGVEQREEYIGYADVLQVFGDAKSGLAAGCLVAEGRVSRSNPIRVLRDNVVIFTGELTSLRRFKDEVDEVRSGTECGIKIKSYADVKVGDRIEVFERVEIQRHI